MAFNSMIERLLITFFEGISGHFDTTATSLAINLAYFFG